METETLFLVIVLIVIVGLVVFILFGMKFLKKDGVSVDGQGERMLADGMDNFVSYSADLAENYTGADEDDDEDYEQYFGGAAAKKAAAKKEKKSESKPKKESKPEKAELVAEEAEPILAKPSHSPSDQSEHKFRGHFLSERVLERHNPETGKVVTYRVSVRGSMKDTHRVLIKLKELTEDHKTDKNGRMRKLKLKGTQSGEYVESEKPEKNRGKFTQEEKEPALRLLQGALNSSMLDESIRQKIMDLVAKKL